LLYRTQVTTSVTAARAAQQRSTDEGGDGAFLTHAFSPDPYLLLATNVEQMFKHIGRTANEIALFCSASLHHHAAAFTNSRVLALSLFGDGLNYDASKETPHQYFLRQNARFNITQSQQTSMPGISNPLFATGIYESLLIYLTHTEIQRAASGVAGKKALTNDNKKRIKKELTEFNKRKTAYKGDLQVTDPTYIAEIFGGPSQAVDGFSSLLQTISDQFTVSSSAEGKVTYKELEDSISLIASGQRSVEVTSSLPGASSFKAQGTPADAHNKTTSTSSDEDALRTKCTQLYRAVRVFEKLRLALQESGASGSSTKSFNIFAHWGVAVPNDQFKGNDGTSSWCIQLKAMLTPMVTQNKRHPANYDSSNGAFVFPIYSHKQSCFHIENMHISGNEKEPFSFSTLFEETMQNAPHQLTPQAVQEVSKSFKLEVTTASEVKSILNEIRDLATGLNTNAKGVLARSGKFTLRPVKALNADIKAAKIADMPADFETKARQFAHPLIRNIGFANATTATKRGGTSFLTAGAAAADEDVDATSAESDTNTNTTKQTSSDSTEETNKNDSKQNHNEENPQAQTVDSAASSLTSASGESIGFIQLAQQYNMQQLKCIIELYEATKDAEIRRHPLITWEHALKFRKSGDSGAQQIAVETAAANLAAAESTNSSSNT
jgi:hypothetical protein